MFKIRIILILISCIIITEKSYAQRPLNYDDIYKAVLSGDKDKSYTLLLAYQKENPDFANTYFQLALIAKDWAKEFNPFTEFHYTKLFIYNTELYFGLAKKKLDEEKKKNIGLYKNVEIVPSGKKLIIEDLEQYINSQIDSIKVFEKNIVKIISYYNKSSNSYNNCVNGFMDINSEYSKIKNIYLTEDKVFTDKISGLETNFDSTLIYFEKYKAAIKKYPVKNYNQTFKVRHIITYRLDGLTYSNFLKNEFVLWDYKTWIKEIKQTKTNLIKNNRADIVSIDKTMKDHIEVLNKNKYSDTYKPYKLDKKFIYKIEKFDNNSFLIKLFKLNEAKIDYLTYFKKSINNPNSERSFSLKKIASFNQKLFKKLQYSDSLNKFFLKNIKPDAIRKYKNFYMSYYNGIQGLKDYSLRQDMFFKQKNKDAKQHLKNYLHSTFYTMPTDSLRYKGKKIETNISFPEFENSEKGLYNLCNFCKNPDNKLWVSGFFKSPEDKIIGFTAFSEDSKTLKFIKKSQKSDTSKIVNLLTEAYQDGTFTIETNLGYNIKNTLVQYSNKGKTLSKTELPFSKIPRYMLYDDINNSIIIVFNGSKIDAIKNTDNEQIIYSLNFEDETKTYTIIYKAKAYVFDILKLNNNILIFSNFINYNEVGNKQIISQAGNSLTNTNILVTIISNQEIIKQVPIKSKQSVFGVEAIKLNSNLINILGFKTSYRNKNFEQLKNTDLYYLLLDSDIKHLYSAWHD